MGLGRACAPGTAVETADGLSFIPGPDVGGGVELVAQAHGGALKAGGTPGKWAVPGGSAQERRPM